MTEPFSLLGSGWPGHASPRRTDLAQRRSKIVAATQIEDIYLISISEHRE
jgi:hypothetical protein